MSDNPNPHEVTPPGSNQNAILAAGGIVVIAMAAGLWLLLGPKSQDKEAQQQHASEGKSKYDRPGDAGNPLFRNGRPEIPTDTVEAKPVADAKPGSAAAAKPVRRRVQYAATPGWTAKPPPAPVASAAKPAGASDADAEAKPVKIGGMQVIQAARIDDPTWFLTPGDKIMCRNNEPLTERAGTAWTAIIPEDKYDRSGTRLLVPKDSEAFGMVAQGLQNGERRLAAIITHIKGPSIPGRPMLFVPIGSGQVGDEKGRVDLDGNVKNDWLNRFATVGAYALLDAVARGGSSYLSGTANRALNGGGDGVNVNIGNLGGMSGQTLAGTEMTRQMNKPPPFDRPEAQDCTIMVKELIDFRKALTVGK